MESDEGSGCYKSSTGDVCRIERSCVAHAQRTLVQTCKEQLQ